MSLRRPRSLSANDAANRRRLSRPSDFVSSRMSLADMSSGLFKAIRASDEAWLNALLAAGAPTNARDDQGRPALCVLLDIWGSPDACKALLERGAQPDLPTAGSGQTALHIAAKKGYQVCIGQLLSAGSAPDVPDVSGNSALMYSCANGHHTSVRMLVKAGASPGRTNQRGETALHMAAKNGSRGCVKELLAANCSVNVVDDRGLTPLLLASMNNWGDITPLLLEQQLCHVDDQDPSTGRTPLHWSVLNHDHPTTRALVDHGASLDLRDADWNTAFLLAAGLRDYDSARTLVEAGCDVAVTDKSFNTALHLTSRDGHADLIPTLFESGLNLDLKGNGGMTALMLGTYGGHREVVGTLLGLGANPNLLDRNRASALIYAMLSNATQDIVNDIVRILIQFNADLDEGANLIGISRGATSLPEFLCSSLEDRLYSPIEVAFLRENSSLCVMLMKVGCDLEPLRQLTATKSNGRTRQTTNANKDLFQKLIQFSRRQRRMIPTLKELSRRPALKCISQFTSLAHIHKLSLPETLIRFLRYEDLLSEWTPKPQKSESTVQSLESGRADTRSASHSASKRLSQPATVAAVRRDTEIHASHGDRIRRELEQDKRTREPVRKATEQNSRRSESRGRTTESNRNGTTTASNEESAYRRRQSRSPFDRRRKTEATDFNAKNEDKTIKNQTVQNHKPGRLRTSLSQGNLRTPQTPRQITSASSQVNLRAATAAAAPRHTPRQITSASSQGNLRTTPTVRQVSQPPKASSTSVAKTPERPTARSRAYSREPCVRSAPQQRTDGQGVGGVKSTRNTNPPRADTTPRTTTQNPGKTVTPASGHIGRDTQPRAVRSSVKSVNPERSKIARKPIETHL